MFGRSGFAMSNNTSAMLRKIGPALTTRYIEALVASGLTPAAARKRVQRTTGAYKKLTGIKFEKNTLFMFHEDDFGKPKFWKNLEEAFYTHGKSYWATIATLRARGGICPIDRFPQVCGSPIRRKGRLSPDHILDGLKAVNFLDEFADGERSYVHFKQASMSGLSIARIRANELAEFVALHGIKLWAQRLGLGSYDRFLLRSEDPMPLVTNIAFDLTAPAFFRPLLQVVEGKAKPGFLACDINLNGIISEEEVEAFVRKCDGAAFSPNIGRIMPMLVGDVFSAKGMSLAKRKGILAITLENLFGYELAKALRDLIGLLSNAGATASMNPDHLAKVMRVLTKVEGSAANLRGDLFELVIGSLVKDVEGGFAKTGERMQESETGRRVEVDVQLVQPDAKSVLIIECKAKLPRARVSEAEVAKWYTDRVPLIYRILTARYSREPRPFHFEFWTNGIFAASALKWLNAQSKTCDGYTVDWKDGAGLKTYAERAKNASLRSMLNEHYFRNAMTVVVPVHADAVVEEVGTAGES